MLKKQWHDLETTVSNCCSLSAVPVLGCYQSQLILYLYYAASLMPGSRQVAILAV